MDIPYILGLIEGEGNFLYKEYERVGKRQRKQTQSKFQIGMHVRDYELLLEVRKTIGFGKVRKYKNTTFFTITSLDELFRLIEIIDEHGGFYGNKKLQYTEWKKNILIKYNKNKDYEN